MTVLLDTVAAERELLVNETFGPTLQGEGPSCGRQAVFIRLASCNLTCAWCDSRFSWDWTHYDPRAEIHHMTCDALATWVLSHPTELVVITGGEPLLQQEHLLPLARSLAEAGRAIEVETNGTVAPDPRLTELVGRYNVSPKLSHAGGHTKRRLRPAALRAFAACGKAIFKVVLRGPGDVPELIDLQWRYSLNPLWIMPDATTPNDVTGSMRDLADVALRYGWNLSPRLHILLWGDERGR